MRSLLVLLALLALPGAAGAATVSYEVKETPGSAAIPTRVEHVLAVQAAPGEQNRITFGLDQAGFSVADATVQPQPGPGCALVDPAGDTVRCDVRLRLDPAGNESVAATVKLGDGDDTARISRLAGLKPVVLTIDGGPGADKLGGADRGAASLDLIGGGGRDELLGGGMRETLKGSGGADVLRGGGGNDLLVGDGRDVLDGGAGADGIGGAGPGTACGAGADRVSPYSGRAFPTLPYDCEVVDLFGDVKFRLAPGGPVSIISSDPGFLATVEVRAGSPGGRRLAARRMWIEYLERRNVRFPRVSRDVVVLVRRPGRAPIGFTRPAR